jgi:hypothetical protein
MEQKLLNSGVLNQKHERDEKQIKDKVGNDDTEWEKKRFFSFGELCKIGFIEKKIGCCCNNDKMKKRIKFYEQVKETFDQRTDVINIMKSVADIDTLKEALLTPYQQRLIQYLAMKKADDDSNEAEMTIKEASDELNKPGKKITLIQEEMDKYLKDNLPKNIVRGRFTEEEEFDDESKVHLSKRRVSKVDSIIGKNSGTLEEDPEDPGKQINILVNSSNKGGAKMRGSLKNDEKVAF